MIGLKQDQTAGAWKALVASLEYFVDAKADAPRRPSAATDWLDAQPTPIDNVCGPGDYTYGPYAQVSARHGEWVDDSALKQWPTTIHHCRLVLDGANLSDVYVWAVLVTYQGGELHLHNVRFGQCRFDLPNGNDANVRKFVDALLAADRNVVTIDLP